MTRSEAVEKALAVYTTWLAEPSGTAQETIVMHVADALQAAEREALERVKEWAEAQFPAGAIHPMISLDSLRNCLGQVRTMPDEGWTWIQSRTDHLHYFRDGRSLCRRWGMLGEVAYHERPEDCGEQYPVCKACAKKAPKGAPDA